MEDSSDYEAYVANRLLSEFAHRLDQISQTEPVIFYPAPGRKGFRLNSVELGDGGLNLNLKGQSPHFIAMEEIGKFTFYKTHPFDSFWVTPEWL